MKRLRFLAKASRISFNSQHAVVRPDIAGTGSASRISTRGRPYSTKFSFAELEKLVKQAEDEVRKRTRAQRASATASGWLEETETPEPTTSTQRIETSKPTAVPRPTETSMPAAVPQPIETPELTTDPRPIETSEPTTEPLQMETSESTTDQPPAESVSNSQLRKDQFRHLNPTTEEEMEDDNLHPTDFKKVMRHVAQSVVIISSLEVPGQKFDPGRVRPPKGSNDQTSHGLSDLAEPIPRAMTVGSFTSLSVKPIPRVMFNVNRPSQTYDAIKTCHRFNIHVLADNEEGALLAEYYSRGQSLIQHAKHDDRHLDFLLQMVPETARNAIKSHGYALEVKDSERLGGLKIHGPHKWNQEWKNWQTSEFRNTWTPVSRDAIPRFEGGGILYTLRCVVRKFKRHGSGLMELDPHTALVVANVQDIIYGTLKPDIKEKKKHCALTYSFQQYVRRGEVIDLKNIGKVDKNGLIIKENLKSEAKGFMIGTPRPQMIAE
ncbi:hypothetical protein G7054_g8466 [Neopestalotiopsis clavispora]|nr:hypothetical protein G7054_g8466 [Neopestalotiopsis clavispora]